jgi:hypothetical protein
VKAFSSISVGAANFSIFYFILFYFYFILFIYLSEAAAGEVRKRAGGKIQLERKIVAFTRLELEK